MKKFLFILLSMIIWAGNVNGQKQVIPSGVYEAPIKKKDLKESDREKTVIGGPTKTLDHFQIKTVVLSPGEKKQTDLPANREAFILIKKGPLGVKVNGKNKSLSDNSVAFLAQGDRHSLFNPGNNPVSFYQVQWQSKIPTDKKRGVQNGGSEAIDFKNMEFDPNKKGGRRQVMRRPTATLRELEMHITTLNEGVTSHKPHVHKDEEIIVVFKGRVEELINGKPHQVEPGSIIYLSSMDPHGIRNIGEGQCEYYAIRWVSTPE